MRMKRLTVAFLFFAMMAGHAYAQSTDVELMAGPSSILAGGAYRNPLSSGYMKVGVSGVFTDDDDTEYQLGNFKCVVGNDALYPGLSIEAGVQGIFGTAEEDHESGDVAAAAFTARAGYLFPRRLVPIPLEVFGGFTYSPGPLAFMDLEEYTEINLGVGLQIIPNATIQLTYTDYEIEMDEGHDDFTVDDNVVRLGLIMHF
jgi:hypothetical protein